MRWWYSTLKQVTDISNDKSLVDGRAILAHMSLARDSRHAMGLLALFAIARPAAGLCAWPVTRPAKAIMSLASTNWKLSPSPWSSPITVEAPGINGGDPWAGARGSDDDLDEACYEAMSATVRAPVIPQFYPQRQWLWKQWQGTIMRVVLPREVLYNTLFAVRCCCRRRARPALPSRCI